MEKYYAGNPQDTEAAILLAYLYKTDRATIPARETLQRYVVNFPGDARAYNNMANISFIRGETDSALRFAQKAADLDSSNAIYQYNLSKLQRAKFNFSEAERVMDNARRLDPILVQNLEGSPQEKLIDAIPSYGLVWQRISQKNGDFTSLLKNPFSLLAIAFLVLTVLFYVQRRTFAASCDKCGKPFCSKCRSTLIKDVDFCNQCLHIFVKKDGVSPVSRKQKMKEIEEYNHRNSVFARILSLVIPGSGSLFQGRSLFGVIVLLAWLFVLVILLFSYHFGNLSYYEPPQTFSVIAPICVFFLAILYVIANITNFSSLRS